jgi:asparagine synthetase B (glutamine-hydrolysing)
MDSSSMAALCQAIGHPPETYTYAFPTTPRANESLEASHTAHHLGLAHTPIGGPEFWLFQNLANPPIQLEENPFFGWDAYDQHLYKAMANRGSKLLLTGQFGDNLFSGERIPALQVDRILHGSLASLRKLWQNNRGRGLPVFQSMYRQVLSPFIPAWLKSGVAFSCGKTPQRPAYLPRQTYRRLGLQRRNHRVGPLWGNASQRAAQAMMIHQTGGIRRAIHWYERCAAPFGIRVEHPFFDPQLVQFMLQLPAREAFPMDLPKGILRQTMADLLPQSTLQRLDKPDLVEVYLEGMRREQGHFEEMFSENSRLAALGLLDARLACQALKRHLLNPLAHSNRFLFAALAERWLRSPAQALLGP